LPSIIAGVIQNSSSATMNRPRKSSVRSIAASLSPLALRFWVLSAMPTPARNTNVGAHKCVIQRSRN
jgi:hypothetical protein